MFGRGFLDDDPFFADHRNAMNSMMRGFGGQLGGGFEAVDDGRRRDNRNESNRNRPVDPFQQMTQQMNSMMQHFGSGMMQMPNMGNQPNGAQSFSHSSVYSYTSDGQGPPKVFQAASEERRGPGGVRETKKAVKDSESGVQRMAVGHHLGERGHVVERSHNLRSGEREEKQDFIGLTEDDGATFNEEWTRATGAGHHRRHHRVERGDGGRQQRALPEAQQRQRRSQHPRDQMLKE